MKYETTNLMTGEKKDFSSRAKIAEFYEDVKVPNLNYHLHVKKKTQVIIRGIFIKIV